MTNTRNIVMLSLLALFFVSYGIFWAYGTLYREPRERLGAKIAQYRQGIDNGRRNMTMMQQVVAQNQGLYFRSLPRIPNDSLSLYSTWFLELLKYCDIREGEVGSDNPTRTAFGGWNYRFHVRGTCSLDRLSRLLFEFYFAPFLHRITTMSISPVEGREEQVTISLMIDALSIPPAFPQNPYPLLNQLPTGHFRRLGSTDLATYQVIADRNLLRAAKGGVDRADHAYLTSIIRQMDGRTEVWLSVRSDNSVVKAVQGETIRIGSFRGTIVEILEEDVIFQRDDMRWLLTVGECLNQAFALPPEVFWPTDSGEQAQESSN